MFDYTKGAISKIIDDLKRISLFANCALHIFQIVYLIYIIFAPMGIFAVNIVLLALCIAHLVFTIYKYKYDVKKSTKKTVKRTYKWIKRGLKLLTLSVPVYGLFFTMSQPLTKTSAISLIVLLFSLISWAIGLLFDIILIITERRFNLFLDALKMDTELAWKANSFINRLKGKDVEEELVSAESREELEHLKEEHKELKKQQTKEEWKKVLHNLKDLVFPKK